MSDDINAPDHYVLGRKYEPIDVMEDWQLINNNYVACAFKYIARCGRKGDPLQDLKKAVYYLNREVQRLEQVDKK